MEIKKSEIDGIVTEVVTVASYIFLILAVTTLIMG
jgi:hypothetical protein